MTFKHKFILDLDTLVTFLRAKESRRDKDGDILLDSEFQGGLEHSLYGWQMTGQSLVPAGGNDICGKDE